MITEKSSFMTNIRYLQAFYDRLCKENQDKQKEGLRSVNLLIPRALATGVFVV